MVLASCGNKYYGTSFIYAVSTSLLIAPGLCLFVYLCSTEVRFYQSQVLPKSGSTKVRFYQSQVLPKSGSTKVRFYQSQVNSIIKFYQIPFYQSQVLPKPCSTKVHSTKVRTCWNVFYQIPFYQTHVLPKSGLL
jgi:hypothetical protein